MYTKLLSSPQGPIQLETLYAFFKSVIDETTERKWSLFLIILIDKCKQQGWKSQGNILAQTFEDAVELAYAEGQMNGDLPWPFHK